MKISSINYTNNSNSQYGFKAQVTKKWNIQDAIATFDRLDAFNREDVIPARIKTTLNDHIANPKNNFKNLVEMHLDVFKGILKCKTLEELKTKFPEFKDVKPSSELTYTPGSFIDNFNRKKTPYFPIEEDLTLQMIKLYWGNALSMNDIKSYTLGKDIAKTLKKMNIPKFYPEYGRILASSEIGREHLNRVISVMQNKIVK